MTAIDDCVIDQLPLGFDHTEDHVADILVHELFEAQARRTPDATAVVCGQAALTYEEVNGRADRLAHRLLDLGVQPDDRVAICVERSLDMVVGLLGILKSGAAYVPLDPNYPEERLIYMLRDSAPKALLSHASVNSGLLARLEQVNEGFELLQVDGDAKPWCDRESEAYTPNVRKQSDKGSCTKVGGLKSSHLAYVIYTSGSTGQPKGVMVEHRALVNFLGAMTEEPGIAEGDVLLGITSLSFDIAGLEIYLPLIHGATLVVAERDDTLDPKRLALLMRRHGVSMMQATPAIWRMLLSQDWPAEGQSLKVLCGGEALTTDLARSLIGRTGFMWNLYGPTETTIWSSVQPLTADSLDGHQPAIGHPIANTRFHVLDADLQPVPACVSGELFIGGDGLARGYLHKPELTAERFISNPFVPGGRLYRTGDLARYRLDGSLDCLGRLDRQVKIRGFRIEPGEIEAALTAVDGIQEAAVVAHESLPGEKHLVAYYVGDAPWEHLRAATATRLPPYMVPSVFIRLARMPTTPNGKLDRNALPAPGNTGDGMSSYEAPHGHVEQAIADIWAEVLKLERVGRRDNFYQLGGHSLLAVIIMARLQSQFSARLSIRRLIDSSTVADVAAAIIELRTTAEESMQLGAREELRI